MSGTYTFPAYWSSKGPIWSDEHPSDDLIRAEPMLFAASLDFARKNCGPLTHAFLDHLPIAEKDYVIDSKVTMLFPGQWPCIPGWHHDDVDRSPLTGQPDYEAMKHFPTHYMGHLGMTGANPEFATLEVTLPKLPPERKVYRAWDRMLDAIDPGPVRIPPGLLVRFGWDTFHRGTTAQYAGWRYWIRATTGSSRKPRDEIRRQVQVYLSDPSEGW